MAAPANGGVVSTFPNPPVYYKRYSTPQDPSRGVEGPPPPPIPADMPDPLILFGGIIHPPFPTLNDPHVYGLGVEQLYPTQDIDIRNELRKLNRSLMLNFLELLDILCKNPTQFPAKIESIEKILANMHHLLNFYRPHQARSYIITVLENQIEKKSKAIETINTSLQSVDAILAELDSKLNSSDTRGSAMVISDANSSHSSLPNASAAAQAHQNGISGASASGSANAIDPKSVAGQLAALQQLMAQLDALVEHPPTKSK